MSAAMTAPRSRAAPVKENDVRIEEGLNLFKSEKFDAESYVQNKCFLNEKDLRQLCSSLLNLKKASAEEMRRSVYANYSAFIRTSKEISDLEGEFLSIRNLLSTQATLIHGLADGVSIDSLPAKVSEGSLANGLANFEAKEPSKLEKWAAEFPVWQNWTKLVERDDITVWQKPINHFDCKAKVWYNDRRRTFSEERRAFTTLRLHSIYSYLQT